MSYTSREPRSEEIDGIDYRFISKEEFLDRIEKKLFYEHVEYDGNYYGTGLTEWYKFDIFIMETSGITHISNDDRKENLVIYVNTPLNIRIHRMRERGWKRERIIERIDVDNKKFDEFWDYDLQISSCRDDERQD